MNEPRLTADILVQGLLPTLEEYCTSLSLLREIAAKGYSGLSAWRATTLTDVETRAWVANAQAGLVRDRPDGQWNVVVLTELGKIYLAQRESKSENSLNLPTPHSSIQP